MVDSGSPSAASPDKRRFTENFGVPEDAGIPRSSQNLLLWEGWASRVYLAIFAGLGCLAISITPALHRLGLALGVGLCGVAVTSAIIALGYHRKYATACRHENIDPYWRRDGRRAWWR